MRTLLTLFAALALSAGYSTAQDCYSSGNYGSGGYSYNCYQPTYRWFCSGVWNCRWYPAGNYCWRNGCWYRQGYGFEYGTPVSNY